MWLRNKQVVGLLALAAVVGMALPAHRAVFCHRADGTHSFEWRCDAADDCDTHPQFDEAAFSPNIGGDDCHDIPARVIVGVNVQSRRESRWLTSPPPPLSAAYLDDRGRTPAMRRPRISLDGRPPRTTGAGAVRTIVLLI